MQEITQSVASIESLKSREILQHQRAVRDQSKLNSQQRNLNIAGAFSATGNLAKLDKLAKMASSGNIGPLIIVDDLVTTGATLAEAIRALRAAGFSVIGAVTGAVANPYD